jgi:hypothetical protein
LTPPDTEVQDIAEGNQDSDVQKHVFRFVVKSTNYTELAIYQN